MVHANELKLRIKHMPDCCKICVPSANSDQEQDQLSVCKYLQDQAKRDCNVLSNSLLPKMKTVQGTSIQEYNLDSS
jgi:hypothetical protein